MKYAKSCGIVVYRLNGDEYEFLLVKQQNGDWSIPKGHVEKNETELETAKREVLEETGIEPEIIQGFKEVINYYIEGQDENKDVVFFLGEYRNDIVKLQKEEIADFRWKNKEDAQNLATYDDIKNIIEKAYNYLNNR